MANQPSSPNSVTSKYAQNRQRLKQEHRQRLITETLPKLKGAWRVVVSLGLFSLGIWVISLPVWEVTDPSQVEVTGTKLLSPQLVKQFVKIDYPTFFYRLRPQAIAAQLEKSVPVHNVVIKRAIFPLKVTVIVQEREPIATASKNRVAGYIDAKGMWIPAQIYSSSFKKPELVVLGLNDQVLQVWRRLYLKVASSSVKITQLDFRRSDNLILTTELGRIYCGEYTESRFTRQLKTLERLRNLPKSKAKLNFSHIDLVNPEYPVVDGVQKKS